MLIDFPALALIEFNNIAAGITSGDAMTKKAPLVYLKAGTVHSGKYLVLIGGDTACVEESFKEGLRVRSEEIVDSVFLADAHEQVKKAALGSKKPNPYEAAGIIETSTVAANLQAADAAVKGAEVEILEMRLADGLGGNSFTLIGGRIQNVQAAIEIGTKRLEGRPCVVHTTVIPRIGEALMAEINKGSRFFS